MSVPFAAEKQVAVAAVRRACTLTSSVFNKLVTNETLVKGDKSPVTVGDFSAQAVVNTILGRAFPGDPIVGEEDATDLRLDSGSALRQRIAELANETLTADLGIGEMAEWGLGPTQTQTVEQLLDAIDRGTYDGGRIGRMWTLDPIDGTKGFLRGEQYAVCLSLIVDAQVQLSVIGCPNLPQDASKPDGPRGCLFVAVRGQGAQQLTLSGSDPTPLKIPPFTYAQLNTIESVEAAHSSRDINERVSQILDIYEPPIRMDSQAKYCALARGDGGVYLRMPTGVGYKEKIWDHAPGSLLVQEAGGVISDSRGEPLDFGLGRTLGENYGVIAAGKNVYSRVLPAVKQALEYGKKTARIRSWSG
jgi:3'(2'), 5'-bisphosphate nucleotidase